MRLRQTFVVLALLAAACVPANVRADEAALQRMVQLLPEVPETYKSLPLFDYVDFRALEHVAGLTPPESEKAFTALPVSLQAAWIKAYKRLSVGGGRLREYALTLRTHKVTALDALGFDWFATDRAATVFAYSPNPVTILAGGASLTDSENFAYALPFRGFAIDEFEGVPVWHRFADDGIVGALHDDAADGDLFLQEFLTGERLATLSGFVIAAHSWKKFKPVIDVAVGKRPAAAASAVIGPLLDALNYVEGADGTVLQASAMALPDVGLNVGVLDAFDATLAPGNLDDIEKKLAAIGKKPMATEKGPPLAAYPLVLFADMQAGTDQVAVIALPYGERADAEAAATVVANRLRQWQPIGATRPVVDAIGGKVESKVVEVAGLGAAVARTFISLFSAVGYAPGLKRIEAKTAQAEGGAVALIVVRYPLPPTNSVEPGTMLSTWLQAIFDRDLKPLAVP